MSKNTKKYPKGYWMGVGPSVGVATSVYVCGRLGHLSQDCSPRLQRERNDTVFHEFFFIRSNLGLELRMGNSPGAAATFEAMDRQGRIYKHPRATIEEARKVKELGEMEYMHQAMNETLA